MRNAAHRVHHTVVEYLELEDFADAKHEYLDGQIYAMAGGTPEHAALSVALTTLLTNQLRVGSGLPSAQTSEFGSRARD